MMFITFETRDEIFSKTEKAWFVSVHWVAKTNTMNRKSSLFWQDLSIALEVHAKKQVQMHHVVRNVT